MSDYDMSIHSNPDAKAWAKFFIETLEKHTPEVFDRWSKDSVESTMLGWFANAMMAMHDHREEAAIQPLQSALDLAMQTLSEVQEIAEQGTTRPDNAVIQHWANDIAFRVMVARKKIKETREGE